MSFNIKHNPLGKEHPYVQGPEERCPRHPGNTEPFELRWSIFPDNQDLESHVLLTGDNGSELAISGTRAGGEDGRSYWKAQVSPRPENRLIRYSLSARRSGEKQPDSVSNEYELYLSRRHELGAVDGLAVEGNTLSFHQKMGKGRLQRTFRFFPDRVVHTLSWNTMDNSVPLAENPGVTAGFSLPSVNVRFLKQEKRTAELDTPAGVFTLDKNRGIVSLKTPRGEFIKDAGPWEWKEGKSGCLALGVQRHSAADEGFYGFGERFNRLNQRGMSLDVRVYEEYKKQDEGAHTYIPVPFFITNKKWGHWTDTRRDVRYDLAAQTQDRWSLDVETGFSENESPEGTLTEYFFLGNPDCVLGMFQEYTGNPVRPPDWAFTPWMSGNEWNTQERVMAEWETSRRLGIPAGVLVIEAWSDEKNFYIWNDAEYEPREGKESFRYTDFTFPGEGKWPCPREMIDKLHSGGTKIVLWQIPLLKALGPDESPSVQRDRDEQHMISRGYCVRHNDGSPYTVRPWWFTHSLAVDFTNPEAEKWWMDKRRYLIEDLEIDGFKTDGGEHLWGHSLNFFNGRRGDELWNEYPLLYESAYYRYLNTMREGAVFSRSGFTGAAASPLHWTGDQDSTWEAHQSVLRAVLNAGLSGIPFIGWDIGGFSGPIPSAELYVRSAAMACFSPLMQYHSELNGHKVPSIDRTPWNIAERTGVSRVVPIYRFFALLRMRLQPWFAREADETCRTGRPLMRPLFFDFPDDPLCWQREDEYLLGSNLLVAPLLNPGETSREIYLPEGEWLDFWSRETEEGHRIVKRDVPWDRIPVFIKYDSGVVDALLSPPEDIRGDESDQ